MAKDTETFGGYILEKEINKSPEGLSYLAYKPENLEKKFFIKKLTPELSHNAAYKKLFFRDAELMDGLTLKGTLTPVEYLVTDSSLGVVYPFCKHKPLSSLWRDGGKGLEEVRDLFTPLAGALDSLHERGLVHGALHEANVVITKEKELVLLNMGICREASWMDLFPQLFCRAPEQLFQKENTVEADRYCFAMLLYAALAGSYPWPSKTLLEESIEMRRKDTILSISSFVYSIDPDLLVAITTMMSLSPAERLPSCTALMNILERSMLRVEESTELGIPPEELKRIQADVDQLDQNLSRMERKISSYQQRLRQTIDTKKEGLARIKKKTKGIQERFSPQIIEAEQNLTRFKRTKLSFIDEIQSYFSPKIQKKRAEKEKTLEGEWIRLGKERDEVIIKENERVREEQEKIHSVYERNMEKVQGALEPLLSEYKTIEEKFFAYGDLNPRLLGFRAKKQFSIATIKIGTVHVDMKLLPSGMFYMGDERTLNPDPEALPLHEVSFKKPFWMSATPITQECYRSVIGKNPSSNKNPKNPVEMVSWFDAIRFCNILSLREKLQPVYEIIEDDEIQVNWQRTASGYRLATEAEWEYAARASSKFLYSGSARAGQVAWFHGNSDGTSHVVAKKGPNDWGLYDLSGNLWEWCWDLKGPYKKGSSVDPIGAKEGNGRVFRGGSYLVKENILMVYHRGFENPNVKSETVGFRVVRDPR